MQTSLVDLLSGADTMILGGIVASAVLAFALVVIIFALRIKALHDDNHQVQHLLEAEQRTTRQLQATLEAKAQHVADTERIAAEAVQRQESLEKSVSTLQNQKKEIQASIDAMKEKIHQSGIDKKHLQALLEAVKGERDVAREEQEATLKRNEFWVAQLSELRTKHEALRLKLRVVEKG